MSTSTTQSRNARAGLDEVRQYWSDHLNLTQFLRAVDVKDELGSPKFFEAVRASRSRFAYKQPLMDEMWTNRRGTKLLEIGCGLGADLTDLARRGFDVVGIDLSPRAAELAKEHLRTLRLTGTTQAADAENLPFDENSFDEIYSTGVFQHTPDPQKAINESVRVLRSGGNMTIILYHRRSWFWLLSRLGKTNVEFQEEEAPIVDAYTRGELRQMFMALDDVTIRLEHYRPVPTKRSGFNAWAYNGMVVPLAKCIPSAILRPFGFHAVIRGRKP